MIFRIDDYNIANHDIIINIINATLKILPNAKIYIWVIVWESDIELLKKILLISSKNILLAFHWFNHIKDEFLLDIDDQKRSFLKWKIFFNKLEYWEKIFIPPFNNFNIDTIKLLKEYNYNYFSINYKALNDNKFLLKNNFFIIETNYFFNKKWNDWIWFIEEKEILEKEIKNLYHKNIKIWIEIHPQFIKTKKDMDKYIFLLNLLNDVEQNK